jgi:L-iditol 2-dehydrogenase
MRAARVAADRTLEVGPAPRPEPGPGEVRVRVEACGICGSDLHLLGHGLLPPGRIPGHEFAGVVEATGPGVAGLAEGSRVAVEPFRSCGHCPECARGGDPLCREAALFGVHADGGLAEAVCVPAERCFRPAAELAPEVLALAEPLAVCVHGLRRGGLAPGARVLVLGAGSVGWLSAFAARALGAREVTVSARHEAQARAAREAGADHVLAEADADAASLRRLGRRTPFDVVVETVGGHADTLGPAVAAMRPGGVVVVLGMFLGEIRLDPMPLLLKEASLVWSYCYHHPRGAAAEASRPDFADAVALLERDPERAARLVTHRVPLADAPRAFALARDRRAGALKVSVRPEAASGTL